MNYCKSITLALQISSVIALAVLWRLDAPLWASALLLIPIFVLPLLQRPAALIATSGNDDKTTELARHLSHATTASALTAAGVSHAAQQLKQKLISLVNSAQRIESNAGQMISTEEATAQLSEQSLSAASAVRSNSQSGQSGLEKATFSIQALAQQANNSRALIDNLSQRSREIQQVASVIQGIASQTNLLALNAAIEAARAGEYGRGFAVVADEVRGLASRTATATKEVESMVQDIQQHTNDVAAQQHKLITDLNSSVQLVENAGAQLINITELAIKVEQQVANIASGTQSNRLQLDELFKEVAQIRQNLSDSDQQTAQLSKSAVLLEGQTEDISEKLSEVSLSDYHQQIYNLAQDAAQKISAQFEHDIELGSISQSALFDRNYKEIANTNPKKYSTAFDKYTDKVFSAIQEPILKHNSNTVFAIGITPEGYIPTHNLVYSQPLTGDYQHDYLHNRTKRIFNDRVGARCGNHQKPLLLQTYIRETGEHMHDISVPIYVHGKHWGGFRIGYRPETAISALS
ncbi:methyl-accepting chemotaxis protein [Denitrificimonas caeni]|uniref:methyl-accepting chemotaxis protein n=1 Tax=Denitrificimonas caeni TaxID=521720 RepID=UPI0019658587|nr:methyl-accepting chemotaxis protein [Denitrificimonas caeni]